MGASIGFSRGVLSLVPGTWQIIYAGQHNRGVRTILAAYLYTFPVLKGTNLKPLLEYKSHLEQFLLGAFHAGSHTVTSYRTEANMADPQGRDKPAKDMNFSSLFFLRLTVNRK